MTRDAEEISRAVRDFTLGGIVAACGWARTKAARLGGGRAALLLDAANHLEIAAVLIRRALCD